MVIAILDPHRNTVTISNAGHEPPLICGANGQVRPMFSDEAGLPLIDCEHDGYLEASVELVPGDRLVFFSDGFPDSTPKTMDVRFGKDRIVQIFRDHKHGGKNFIDKVVAQIDDFVGNGPQFDDMCMIYLARN